MNKIAVIATYYGNFPWYFEFFLHSCGFNKTIDFYIVTDIPYNSKNAPGNVRFINLGIEDIEIRASRSFGFEVSIKNGYKLCDYKPAYGVLFADILHGYDFWAQTDIDVIFGDLRNFLDEEMLEYDYIGVRHDFTAGCFFACRNNDLMNNLFMRGKDFKKIFSTSKHYCFDECNFMHAALRAGKSIFDISTEVESYTYIVKKAQATGEIRAHFDFILIEGLTGKIRFDNGKIILMNRWEAILYHLYHLKQVYHPPKLPKKIPDSYRISSKRIYR